ncbi:hypothetical protein DI53_0383 [Sphingobacterium deserti]|uniref:Uncharacterized protein n=1 Tax=Sphingobacterium deserti TaxID=1229276 RepID=A0A0B8TC13_9SPHI|nr:hypothetical protein DI53_0383 [Sphingobacterium deserti]
MVSFTSEKVMWGVSNGECGYKDQDRPAGFNIKQMHSSITNANDETESYF